MPVLSFSSILTLLLLLLKSLASAGEFLAFFFPSQTEALLQPSASRGLELRAPLAPRLSVLRRNGVPWMSSATRVEGQVAALSPHILRCPHCPASASRTARCPLSQHAVFVLEFLIAFLLLNDSAAERTPPGVLTLSDLDSAVWTWAMSSLVLSAFLGEERWGDTFPQSHIFLFLPSLVSGWMGSACSKLLQIRTRLGFSISLDGLLGWI